VERFYSDIVFLADTPEAFVAQIDAALNEPAEERARKNLREEKILAEQAWDAIAENMKTLMDREWAKTLAGKQTASALRSAASPRLTATVPAGSGVALSGTPRKE
ncbi:MAG TPA: hypothetical protein VFB21_02280, partial [Chthonomonadaceae bacterium]|nr:hypothetical protein [Chthonomonadaceae bacterium]